MAQYGLDPNHETPYFALENHEALLEDLKMSVDDHERREIRDRRQQHKFAVKFSNRRK